jgi:hypothetical protein
MSTKDKVAAIIDVAAERIFSLEVRGELLRLLFANALKRLHAETGAELDAFFPQFSTKPSEENYERINRTTCQTNR